MKSVRARILELASLPRTLSREKLDRLLGGLRQRFPYTAFHADVEREKCVFAAERDPMMMDLMRAFCQGFVCGES